MKSCCSKRIDAVALVIVLGVLTLLAATAILFLTQVGGERAASRQITDSHRAQELAQSAVDKVAGIIASTTGEVQPGEEWVSQPGMLRVFNKDGSLKRAIKLYSAENEVITSQDALLDEVAADVPGDWATQPYLYTDLNAPDRTGRYPIVPPSAETQVAGFSAPDGVAMPVRWWYLYKDGSLKPEPGMDAVGRVAWWTDDETAKVNVNTASEGAFYDYPRNSRESSSSVGWKHKIPARFEFNLHMGHPATTSLSPIFPGLTAQQLINASPHVRWGGTKGQTVATATLNSATVVYTSDFEPAPLSQGPLYPTLDEYFYSGIGEEEGRSSHLASKAMIDQARFFATTRSAGSNLNPFGLPRVSLWPVSDDPEERSPYDQKSVIASTYGGKAYYFTRKNPLSDSEDIAITRNRELFSWLIAQTRRVIPGVATASALGGSNHTGKPAYSLAGKYGADEWKQIMAGIFSYIRLTNILDASPVPPSKPYMPDRDPDRYTAASDTGLTPGIAGAIIPIRIPADGDGKEVYGFGRHPLLTEVAMHVFVIEQEDDKAKLGVNLYFETSASAVGMPIAHPYMTLEVQGALIFHDGARFLTASYNGSLTSNEKINYNNFQYDGSFGISYTLSPTSSGFEDRSSGEKRANLYPFKAEISNVKVPLESPEEERRLTFTAGNLTVKIKINNTEIKSYRIIFPGATLPFPKFEGQLKTETSAMVPSTFAERLVDPYGKYSDDGWMIYSSELVPALFKKGDVVRSMVTRYGDSRIQAMAKDIPQNLFVPHPDYYDETVMHAHDLVFRGGIKYIYDNDDLSKVKTRFTTDETLLKAPDPLKRGSIIRPREGYTNPPELPRSDLYNTNTHAISGFKGGFEGKSVHWARDWNYNGGARIILSDGSIGDVVQSQTRLGFSKRMEQLFAPLRQVASAVQFGMIPSGVQTSLSAAAAELDAARPWQTLLFAPNPVGPISGTHIGLEQPKDHYLLDFFHHPVVEPYAMTVPGSSYGQINLNLQIMPFTSIKRITAWHSLLKAVRVNAVRNENYDNHRASGAPSMRLQIDVDRTAAGWLRRLEEGGVYRSPSEVASLFLVPKISSPSSSYPQPDYDDMPSFWRKHLLTGDDIKEQPYNAIYPRVTTRSNTYRVHVIAQSLSPAFGRNLNAADGGAKYVTGEWRGSMLLERSLMPEARLREIQSGSGQPLDPDKDSLEPYHTISVIGVERF